jgi:hypothetical protein
LSMRSREVYSLREYSSVPHEGTISIRLFFAKNDAFL